MKYENFKNVVFAHLDNIEELTSIDYEDDSQLVTRIESTVTMIEQESSQIREAIRDWKSQY